MSESLKEKLAEKGADKERNDCRDPRAANEKVKGPVELERVNANKPAKDSE